MKNSFATIPMGIIECCINVSGGDEIGLHRSAEMLQWSQEQGNNAADISFGRCVVCVLTVIGANDKFGDRTLTHKITDNRTNNRCFGIDSARLIGAER